MPQIQQKTKAKPNGAALHAAQKPTAAAKAPIKKTIQTSVASDSSNPLAGMEFDMEDVSDNELPPLGVFKFKITALEKKEYDSGSAACELTGLITEDGSVGTFKHKIFYKGTTDAKTANCRGFIFRAAASLGAPLEAIKVAGFKPEKYIKVGAVGYVNITGTTYKRRDKESGEETGETGNWYETALITKQKYDQLAAANIAAAETDAGVADVADEAGAEAAPEEDIEV